jgi:hypothetical protein
MDRGLFLFFGIRAALVIDRTPTADSSFGGRAAGALPFPTGREIIHISGILRPVFCAQPPSMLSGELQFR